MATTATLTATVPTPSSADSTKRKSDDNRKVTQRRLSPGSMDVDSSETLSQNNSSNRTTPTFRIPKIERPSSDLAALSPPSDSNESLSTMPSKNNPNFQRQSSDDSNSQQGKRKFSLSQYKERKRLKSDELQQPVLSDTDMRINPIKNSPPTPMDDEPSISIETVSMGSPKSDETSKDTVMKSNLSEPGVRKVIKKKVIWADEKNQSLVQTSFFEVDDSELSEMHLFARNSLVNIPIAQLEKVMERDLRKRRGIQDINTMDNDDKQFSTPLPPLIKILLPDTIQFPQILSQERFVQEEREKTVLQALFIPAFLPDSPGEPDADLLIMNNSERNEPKLIPLDDDTSSCISSKVTSLNNHMNVNTATTANINSSSLITTPISTTNMTASTTESNTTSTSSVTSSLASFPFGDMSPEVAHILAQAKCKVSSATSNQTSTLNTNPSMSPTSTASTVLNPAPTSTLPVLPNLPAPGNFLSSLFNTSRTPNADPSTAAAVPPTNLLASLLPNLSMNFNLPPPPPTPANFPLAQFLVNTFPLGLTLPTANAPLFPNTTSTTTTTNVTNNFNLPTTNMPNLIGNSIASQQPTPQSTNNTKPPTVRFVSAMGQQNRSNIANSNDHQISSSRENSREHHFRRGPPNNHHHNNHHQHHHHRRNDYYPNRQQHQHQQQNNNNNNNNQNNRNFHP